jgi:hypothetical protein
LIDRFGYIGGDSQGIVVASIAGGKQIDNGQ